jgi:hypothetical protein
MRKNNPRFGRGGIQKLMLSLVTCTGGRPEAFALLERWIAKQTYRGDRQWIVVDDCDPATPVTMGQTVIRPFDRWTPGRNTLARNLRAAIPIIEGNKVLFLEDDDYYGRSYLDAMSERLDVEPITGQRPARYYNISALRYREFSNMRRASLCQTGLSARYLNLLDKICAASPSCIDFALWSSFSDHIPFEGNHVVGMKSMPGRKGIGVGHDPEQGLWRDDSDLLTLRNWIGNDAEFYTPYCGSPLTKA